MPCSIFKLEGKKIYIHICRIKRPYLRKDAILCLSHLLLFVLFFNAVNKLLSELLRLRREEDNVLDFTKHELCWEDDTEEAQTLLSLILLGLLHTICCFSPAFLFI